MIPPPTPVEDISGSTQLIFNFGVGVAAFLGGLFVYFRRPQSSRTMEIAGGLVSSRDLEPITNALNRVANVLERRVEQWEEREVQEREKAHRAEVEELKAELRRARDSLGVPR